MDRSDVQTLATIWEVEVSRITEREVYMQCPFAPLGHGHRNPVDQNPNFSITTPDQGPSVCFCFACGNGGTLKQVAYRLATESDLKRYQVGYAFVKKNEGGPYDPLKVTKAVKKKSKAIKLDPTLNYILQASTKEVSPILRARGITPGDVKKWNLRYDPLNHRDLFPMYDFSGKLIAISGRRVHAEQLPKYYHYGKNPDSLTKMFYGEQFLDPTVPEGVLVEGPLDTIATSRHYPNVLGMSGVATMTDARLQRLKRWFQALTLLFDADSAGSTGMFKVGLRLFKHFVLFVGFLPEGLDPFDASAEERKMAMEERKLWSLVDWGSKGVT